MIRERLKDIFHNVNEWLKFAEAKHGVLIVLNSGIAFGTLTIYKEYKEQLNFEIIFIGLVFISLSILLTLISLFPSSAQKEMTKKKPSSLNLYFTGHIASLNKEEFKNELLKIDPSYSFDRLDDDLIREIIRNSCIAARKYKLFRYALIATIIGLIIPLLYILVRSFFIDLS